MANIKLQAFSHCILYRSHWICNMGFLTLCMCSILIHQQTRASPSWGRTFLFASYQHLSGLKPELGYNQLS